MKIITQYNEDKIKLSFIKNLPSYTLQDILFTSDNLPTDAYILDEDNFAKYKTEKHENIVFNQALFVLYHTKNNQLHEELNYLLAFTKGLQESFPKADIKVDKINSYKEAKLLGIAKNEFETIIHNSMNGNMDDAATLYVLKTHHYTVDVLNKMGFNEKHRNYAIFMKKVCEKAKKRYVRLNSDTEKVETCLHQLMSINYGDKDKSLIKKNH